MIEWPSNEVILNGQEWREAHVLAQAALEAVDRSHWSDFAVTFQRTSTGRVQVYIMPVPPTRRRQGNMRGRETNHEMWAYSTQTH